MNTTSIKAYPTEASQIEALKAFLKALKIKFEEATDLPFKMKNQDMAIKKQNKNYVSISEVKKQTNSHINSLDWKK